MDNSVLVIIDVQEKFVPVVKDIDEVVLNIVKLVKSFKVMGIPIILTEQYPQGLGKTVEKIREETEYKPIKKSCFDCFDSGEFVTKIRNKKNIILTGIESHVCVIQTLISGISKGHNVHLVKDAVSSRKDSDRETAIERAKQEGAMITSTEMIIFQMLKRAGTHEFRKISKIIK